MDRRPLVLIVGHGSRDAAANDEFEQLVARYQARHPELELRYGYVELAQPSLAEALAGLSREAALVTVVPLFLFAAGHLKNDVPLALAAARERSPGLSFHVTREIGIHPRMVELALQRAESVWPLEPDQARRTMAVVVGRGSSDMDANGDFRTLVRMFQDSRAFRSVAPAFMAVARPGIEETLELAVQSRPERLLVVPYLLFGGRLVTQLQEQVAAFRARYAWIETAIAPHLGGTDQVLDVLDQRLAETGSG